MAIVPLANRASSSTHTVSVTGVETDARRAAADASDATGPCIAGPFSSSRTTGGVFLAATSMNGLTV